MLHMWFGDEDDEYTSDGLPMDEKEEAVLEEIHRHTIHIGTLGNIPIDKETALNPSPSWGRQTFTKINPNNVTDDDINPQQAREEIDDSNPFETPSKEEVKQVEFLGTNLVGNQLRIDLTKVNTPDSREVGSPSIDIPDSENISQDIGNQENNLSGSDEESKVDLSPSDSEPKEINIKGNFFLLILNIKISDFFNIKISPIKTNFFTN